MKVDLAGVKIIKMEQQDVFEIADFTTATEWERFIARIEEVIFEWKLPEVVISETLKKGDLASGEWHERSEHIFFSDFKFIMTYHYLKLSSDDGIPATELKQVIESEEEPRPQALLDMMSANNDFPPRAHCLVRWYGLRGFVTISPAESQAISTESKAKLLLSSVSVAVNNTNCQIPFFVQVHPKYQKFYLGVCEGGGVRTDFQMVHLKRPPQNGTHLSGLLDIFKGKLNASVQLPPVTVSVRFTYVLSDWTSFVWTQEPPDFDSPLSDVGVAEINRLPFGACVDPISELHLSVTWSGLSEHVVVDSDVYSDLDPLQASHWSVRIRPNLTPLCLLTEYLQEFSTMFWRRESTQKILGDRNNLQDTSDSVPYGDALQRLTQPTLPAVLSHATHHRHPRRSVKRKTPEGPIEEDLLIPLLSYLFPDSDLHEKKHPYPSSFTEMSFPNLPSVEEHKDKFRNFKTAPYDSLVWRLSLVLVHIIHSLGGIEAAAHLWQELVLELRYRWENGILIPGLETGAPNLGSCLINQKLQMLNCCIQKKLSRESRESKGISRFHTGAESSGDENGENDDEFFECSEEVEEEPEEEVGRYSLWNQPDGRLSRCADLRLINTGEVMYIPKTQEPAPMTEDLLEEHAEVLVKLGADNQGSELRARMMSASLLSDMEAFKSANPGSVLEDFIRWYSPRDWIEDGREEGSQKGHLSARMLIPGNTWMEVWSSAKPVPAHRQRRLFDDTKEAEKVLHHLASMSLGQVTQKIFPVLLHVAMYRILEEDGHGVANIPTKVANLINSAANFTKISKPEPRKIEELVSHISLVETLLAQIQSVRYKFSLDPSSPGNSQLQENQRMDLEKVVSEMMEFPEVSIVGGSRSLAGMLLRKMFQEAQKEASLDTDPVVYQGREFPLPAGREYLLRTSIPRPAPYSSPSPQRMFCVLTNQEFRLAGAFSQDTTFQ